MLLNTSRAYEIMDKHQLDGLIASLPINIYYLTDHWGLVTNMNRPFAQFALLPRNPDAPAALITSAKELIRLAMAPTWVPNVIAYTYRVSPNMREFDPMLEEPEAANPPDWPVNPEASLSSLEQQWVQLGQRQQGRAAATSSWGLHQALREAGLEKARLGADDPRVFDWMHSMGMTAVTGIDALNVFREIRMVKSEAEIALMKESATRNEQAVMKAIGQARVGMSWDEVEGVYFGELARLGGRGVYVACGNGGLPNGVITAGEPFMVDALGQYRQYHGDLGRTIVAGEPSAALIAMNRAMRVGWETVLEFVRAGVTASQVTSRVLQAVRKAGFPGFFIVTPHSVGLEHTDHPLALGAELPGAHGDLELLENMVINVDMPYYEFGLGSLHIEDTIRITRDGCEVLTSGDTALQVLPA